MITAHYIPSPPLSEFVKVIWYWDGYVQAHTHERLLPDGSMTIAFNLGRLYDLQSARVISVAGGDVIAGARSTYMVADTANMVTTLGIQFKPGGAFPFLGMPAAELDEQCLPLSDVFGDSAIGLREQLVASETPQQKFVAAERWLLARAGRPLKKHPAVEYATNAFLRNSHHQPLSQVLDRIGYSQRYFNQLFAEEVGLSPKRFLRVRRFQQVIASVKQSQVNWAELASMCGYYDQSHFVHDFRSFSGLTPAAYLAHRTPHLNHVPILD